MCQSKILEAAKRIGEITAKKNEKYGNSVEVTTKILLILYPNGIRPNQYQDAFLIVRTLDKINRIVTDADAFGENPFLDIAGYGLMGEVLRKKEEKGGDI